MLKKLDRKIILQLLKDGRQSLSEIAEAVGTTRQTVAKKIEFFQKKGLIRSFSVELDSNSFGLGIKAYILMREDPRVDLRRKHEETIKRWPQVSEFCRLFGKYDSIIEVLVRDKEELKDLVKRLHELEGVKETETYIVYSTIKHRPQDPFRRLLSF